MGGGFYVSKGIFERARTRSVLIFQGRARKRRLQNENEKVRLKYCTELFNACAFETFEFLMRKVRKKNRRKRPRNAKV